MPTTRQTRRPFGQKALRFETLEDRRLLAAGMLDPTFGVEGKVTTDFVGYSDRVSRVAVQTDRKIVVVGYSVHGANGNFTDHDLAVARYNADGTLDTSFDGDGKLTTDVSLFNDFPDSLALQGDGKIVVGGASYDGSKRDFFLVRYNVDGTLDSSFDGDGKLTTDCSGSVALQSDDKIVVAGSSNGDFAMLRYNADGTLDSSFDGDGKLTTDFGGQSEGAGTVTLQSDGKIVVAGSSNNDFALARYNADGTLDATFGLGGKVTTDFGKNEFANSVALQSDGKIVVAGNIDLLGDITDGSFALARYNADGTLDSSFSADGKATLSIGRFKDFSNGMALQSDGKIVVAGSSQNGLPSGWDISLARFNTNGTLDLSFDGDGKVVTDFGGSHNGAHGVALQSDGKIIAAGYRMTGSTTSGTTPDDFAIARYEGDPVKPPALTGDFNRSGMVDAADYVLWRNTRGLAVAVYSGADGDGNGTIDQDDYDLWKANFGRTLPVAVSSALAAPTASADLVTIPLRSLDSAASAVLPTTRLRSHVDARPARRDIAAFATAHDHALLAWLATILDCPARDLSTSGFSGSRREPSHDEYTNEVDIGIETAFGPLRDTE